MLASSVSGRTLGLSSLECCIKEVFLLDVTSNMTQPRTSTVYLFINVVAVASLLVASVRIITNLQISVMERIREIGSLGVLGSRKSEKSLLSELKMKKSF